MIEPGFYLIDSRGYYLAKEFVSSITNKPDCTMTNTLNHAKCYQDAEKAQAYIVGDFFDMYRYVRATYRGVDKTQYQVREIKESSVAQVYTAPGRKMTFSELEGYNL